MMISSDFKETFTVWNREFEIDVSFVCHKGEKVLDNQISIYNYIKQNKDKLFDICKNKIYKYVEKDIECFPDNKIPENIFKFINPEAIIIERVSEYDYYGMLFLYRYDEENNICVSFKNNEFFEIGPECIIL